jgi:hypothetical protein
MRAPQGTDNATVERFANGAWTALETLPVGIVSMFQANPTDIGDLALIVAGVSQPGSAGPGTSVSLGTPGVDVGSTGIDPLIIFGVGAIALWLLVFAFVVWQRVRPAPAPGVPVKRARDRIPSKQRPPKRPGSGRSNE